MLALLQSLAEALRLYLVVQAYRARWDLERDVDNELRDLRHEIETLRSSTSLADRDESERLRLQLEARNGLALDLRTSVNRAAEGPASPDAGRGVPPNGNGNLAQP